MPTLNSRSVRFLATRTRVRSTVEGAVGRESPLVTSTAGGTTMPTERVNFGIYSGPLRDATSRSATRPPEAAPRRPATSSSPADTAATRPSGGIVADEEIVRVLQSGIYAAVFRRESFCHAFFPEPIVAGIVNNLGAWERWEPHHDLLRSHIGSAALLLKLLARSGRLPIARSNQNPDNIARRMKYSSRGKKWSFIARAALSATVGNRPRSGTHHDY